MKCNQVAKIKNNYSEMCGIRIGNIGDVHPEDFKRLIEAIRECK